MPSLNKQKDTIFIELLLFSDEPVHPETVVIIKDEFLVIWVFGSVIFQQMVAFLVLSQFKQVLGQQQHIFCLGMTLESRLVD